MPEEKTGVDSGTSTQTGVEEAPTDFREYVKWRTTGEKPQQPPSAAAEETTPAKTAPDSETESQESQDTEETPSERKRSGARNRRIDRLTREIEDLKRQLSTTPGSSPAEPPPPVPIDKQLEDRKPKLERFQTLEAYQEALTDWKMDQREQIAKAKADTERVQNAWAEKEKAAIAAHPDFTELTESVEVPNTIAMQAARMAMLEDEHGAEILYWLGQHPDEVKRISGLTAVGAVREIGRIGAQFSSTSIPVTTTAKHVTSAPKPPPSITRPTKTSTDSIYDPEVAGDWKRWIRAREQTLKR